MAIKHINFVPQERLDIPSFGDQFKKAFYPKSREQILGDMISSFNASSGSNIEITPGSMICTLLTIVADQLATFQRQMQMNVQDCDLKIDQFGNPMLVDVNVKLNKPIDFMPINIMISEASSLVCECGSEKAGSNKHSTWCKKFNPDV